jgi:hypothetical protein
MPGVGIRAMEPVLRCQLAPPVRAAAGRGAAGCAAASRAPPGLLNPPVARGSDKEDSSETISIMKVAIESGRDTDGPCRRAMRYSHFARERVWCFRIIFSKDGTELRQSRLRPCGVTPVWP